MEKHKLNNTLKPCVLEKAKHARQTYGLLHTSANVVQFGSRLLPPSA